MQLVYTAPSRTLATERLAGAVDLSRRSMPCVDDRRRAAALATGGGAGPHTVVLLGHEHEGVPRRPGTSTTRLSRSRWSAGASLNVAVARSLVLYRLGGLM